MKKKGIRLKLSEHRFINPYNKREYWKFRINAVPKRIAKFKKFRVTRKGMFLYLYPEG